jgi:hypothetical protein
MSISASVAFTGSYANITLSPIVIQLNDLGDTVAATITVSGVSLSGGDYLVYTWTDNSVLFRTTQTTTLTDTANNLDAGLYVVVITHYNSESSIVESTTVSFTILQSDSQMFQIIVSQSSSPPQQVDSNLRVVCDDVTYITLNPGDVVKGLVRCHNGKFYMFIGNISTAVAYPAILTINNTFSGKYYAFIIQNQPSPPGYFEVPAALEAGCYIVTLSDANGLTQTVTFVISRPSSCKVTVTPCEQSLLCFNGTTGSLTATVLQTTNGCSSDMFWCDMPQYSYRWTLNGLEYDPSTGQTGGSPVWTTPEEPPYTTMTLNNLGAGCYCVYVKEICSELQCSLESCCLSDCAKICQPTPIYVNICPDKLYLDCNGGSDGRVSVWAIGGTPPFMYTLNAVGPMDSIQKVAGPQIGNTFCNLSAGDYQIVVTDNNGCTATDTFTISQPSPVEVTIVTISDECGTRLKATATGGTICCSTQNCKVPIDCYRYEWVNTKCPSNIISTASCTGLLTPGTYKVTVFDSKCCSGHATADVLCVPLCVKAKRYCSNACTFRLKVCVTNGVPPYKYEVNGTCLDDDIECYDFLTKNQFTLKVTDSRGNIGETVF